MQPVLDTELGIQKVGGDPKDYRELLADFIQELPEKIQRMYGLCEAHDLEKLSRAAHNLKGVAATLGAIHLSNLAHQLDEQGSAEDADGLRETIQDLEMAAHVLSDHANPVSPCWV